MFRQRRGSLPNGSRLRSLARAAGLRRANLAAARLLAERYALSLVRGPRERRTGRILCYHSVGTPAWGVNDVSPGRFRLQVEWALRNGYRFVPAQTIARTGGGPRDLAITFDDGLASVATNAAPVLTDLGIPWTMFVVSDWAAGRHGFGDNVLLTWDDIARLADQGVEIGSHSVTHPDFGRLDAAAALDELERSRAAIEQRIGRVPTTFAIPLGGSRNWTPAAQALARQAGYEIIYAQAEGSRPAGTAPRSFITRFDGARIFAAVLAGVFDEWEERL